MISANTRVFCSAVSIDRGTSDQVDGLIIPSPAPSVKGEPDPTLVILDVATASSISDHRTNPW